MGNLRNCCWMHDGFDVGMVVRKKVPKAAEYREGIDIMHNYEFTDTRWGDERGIILEGEIYPLAVVGMKTAI